MRKNVIVLGCNIIGLYSAMKLVELGYDVSIIDKKDTFGKMKNNNYSIFNSNHIIYINLLNKFAIKYSPFSIRENERLFNLMTYIVAKSRLIPNKNILSQSFAKFCKSILNAYEYEILRNNLEDFEYIYGNMNAMDCLTMFSNDITNKVEYFKLDDDVAVLANKMLEYLAENGATIIQNTDVKDFKCENGIYYVNGMNGSVFQAQILVATFCKKNLMQLKTWSKDQRSLLNQVSTYYIDSNAIYKTIKSDLDDANNLAEHNTIRNEILEKLHISYPIVKSNLNSIDLWNVGTNSIIVREKIKNIGPGLFICNASHSKNPLFINYALETFDVIMPRIIRI
jgi:hypothetical protein